MRMIKPRAFFLAVAFLCVCFMGYAFYAEHFLELTPCPLCMLQRGAILLILALCLVAAAHNPKGRVGWKVYGTLGLLFAALGASISGRHVWLQSLPEDLVPACAPSLEYMLDVFPLGEMLSTILMTSGECADIDWVFLGLSMPAWTLIWFVIFGLVLTYAGWAYRSRTT
ncbi:MAG: disulfide bond formation protein B [Xanthomonadales bacterium]|nr:disulfide bond formation protein B [Xanthomonadales bacterium]